MKIETDILHAFGRRETSFLMPIFQPRSSYNCSMNMLTIEQYKQYTYYKFHFNNHRVLFTFVFNIEKKIYFYFTKLSRVVITRV